MVLTPTTIIATDENFGHPLLLSIDRRDGRVLEPALREPATDEELALYDTGDRAAMLAADIHPLLLVAARSDVRSLKALWAAGARTGRWRADHYLANAVHRHSVRQRPSALPVQRLMEDDLSLTIAAAFHAPEKWADLPEPWRTLVRFYDPFHDALATALDGVERFPQDHRFSGLAIYQAVRRLGRWKIELEEAERIGEKCADRIALDPHDRIHAWYGPMLVMMRPNEVGKSFLKEPARGRAALRDARERWERRPTIARLTT